MADEAPQTAAERADLLKAKIAEEDIGKNQRKKARKKLSRLFQTALNPAFDPSAASGGSRDDSEHPASATVQLQQRPDADQEDPPPDEVPTQSKRRKLQHQSLHRAALAAGSGPAAGLTPERSRQLTGAAPRQRQQQAGSTTGASPTSSFAVGGVTSPRPLNKRAKRAAAAATAAAAASDEEDDGGRPSLPPSRASSHTHQPDSSSLMLPEADVAEELSQGDAPRARTKRRPRKLLRVPAEEEATPALAPVCQQATAAVDASAGGTGGTSKKAARRAAKAAAAAAAPGPAHDGLLPASSPAASVQHGGVHVLPAVGATLQAQAAGGSGTVAAGRPAQRPLPQPRRGGVEAADLSHVLRLIRAEGVAPAPADSADASLQSSQPQSQPQSQPRSQSQPQQPASQPSTSAQHEEASAEPSHGEDVRSPAARQQQQHGDGDAPVAGTSGRSHAQTSGGRKKREKQLAPYGNYHTYYGYRQGQAQEQDPRLKLFEAAWFSGRRVLDVGCNEGLVTLAVASHFGVARMLGVDIDQLLVTRADGNLARARAELSEQMTEAQRVGSGGVGVSAPPPLGGWPAAREAARALSRTAFRCEDWVTADGGGRPGSTDTILCLSVTKWVHVNHGDDGLRALFSKFKRVLSPGGYLILEPQPWRSYRRAVSKLGSTGLPCGRVADLELRPDDGFAAELARGPDGLHLVRELRGGTGAGFDRAMYLFQKPPLTPAEGAAEAAEQGDVAAEAMAEAQL